MLYDNGLSDFDDTSIINELWYTHRKFTINYWHYKPYRIVGLCSVQFGDKVYSL